MLSVQELRGLVLRLPSEAFRRQMGPFVLVQRPASEPGGTPLMGLPSAAAQTQVVSVESVSAGSLSLLFQFDDLVVASLPPLHGVDELTVGRQPDCDLVVDDPSVSKRHALLRWDEAKQVCTVQDLESLNGTWLNASIRVTREMGLRNGDILSFGDAQYWYLMTQTLQERLKTQSFGHNST
jgi:hypothetical protein